MALLAVGQKPNSFLEKLKQAHVVTGADPGS